VLTVQLKKFPCSVCNSGDFVELFCSHGNRGVEWVPQEHRVVACKNCGLSVLNPRMEAADLARYYQHEDRKKTVPRAISHEELRKGWIHHEAYADFLEQSLGAGCLQGKSVLDVGSGLGTFPDVLSRRGAVATALEASPFAQGVLKGWGTVEVLEGSLGGNNNGCSRRSWDIVTSLAVIEHVNHPVEFVKELSSAVKPGGYLYINTPDAEEPMFTDGWDMYFKFVHTYYFTKISLMNVLRLAGFEILTLWRQPRTLLLRNFLHPRNGYMGMLHVLGRKGTPISAAQIVKEDPLTIKKAASAIHRSDRWIQTWAAIWRNLPPGIRIAKDRFVPKIPVNEGIRFNPSDLQRISSI